MKLAKSMNYCLQDERLQESHRHIEDLQYRYNDATSQLEELRRQVQQLRDQNALLKATNKGKNTDSI